MVTEGLPVGCESCFEDGLSSRRPSTSSRSINPSECLAGITRGANRVNSSSSDRENGAEQGELQRSQSMRAQPSTIATPPGSPRVKALQSVQNANHRRDSSFRKTYDDNDMKRAIPCENCALTLPKKTKENSNEPPKMDNSGPILRTRKPYERVAVPIPTDEPSPPKSSNSSESEDSETAPHNLAANLAASRASVRPPATLPSHPRSPIPTSLTTHLPTNPSPQPPSP